MPKKRKAKGEGKVEEVSVANKKKGKKSRLLLTGLIVLLIALIALVGILLLQLGVVDNPFTNLHFQPKEFIIKDECSMIVGNLIHSIQDEGVCEQKCKTDCDVRDMFYYDFEFTEKMGDCHECKCYCR
jgi:hypothetical protein